jgi:hypothetical protein
VANLVADWAEQEASRVERIALLQSRESGSERRRLEVDVYAADRAGLGFGLQRRVES